MRNNIKLLKDTYIQASSGVSRISFRGVGGGVQNFSGKVGYLHGASRHAARGKATRLLGGFEGMLPRENFLKMVQFGAFYRVFC